VDAGSWTELMVHRVELQVELPVLMIKTMAWRHGRQVDVHCRPDELPLQNLH